MVDLGCCRKEFTLRRAPFPNPWWYGHEIMDAPGITPLRSSNSKPHRNLSSYFVFLWAPPLVLEIPDLHRLVWSPVARVLLSQRHPGSRKHSFYCHGYEDGIWERSRQWGWVKMEDSMFLKSMCFCSFIWSCFSPSPLWSCFDMNMAGMRITWSKCTGAPL